MVPVRSDDWISLLHRLAECSDAVALRYFRSPALEVLIKDDGSPVTSADLEVERELRVLVQKLAPGLGVLGEEFGARAGTCGARLILDPIDATSSFLRGNPVFATLLAVEVDGRVIAGMASAPALRHRWWASRGHGAFRDGERLRVSGCTRLSDCRLFHGTPTESAVLARYPDVPLLVRATQADSTIGDFLQHLRVAEGRGEAAFDLDVEPWDVAALKLIVEEARGVATAADGSDRIDGGTLVCTNGLVHDAVLSFLHLADTFRSSPQKSAAAA